MGDLFPAGCQRLRQSRVRRFSWREAPGRSLGMVIIRPSSRSHKSGTKSCAIRCINVTFKRLSTNTAIRNRPAGPSRAVSGGSMLLSRATFRTGILDFAHLSSTAVTTRHNFDSSLCLHKPRIIQITCYSCPSSAFSKARQSRKIILGPYGLFEHDLRPMSRLLSLASQLTFRKGPEYLASAGYSSILSLLDRKSVV